MFADPRAASGQAEALGALAGLRFPARTVCIQLLGDDPRLLEQRTCTDRA